MSVKVETVETNVQELEVTVEAQRFSQAVNQAAKKLGQKLNIPGFRKGKAPKHIVESYVGTDALYEEAIDSLINHAYREAVIESGIEPVDRPNVDFVQVEEGKDFIFKAKVTVKPEVVLGEYKGLDVAKIAATVSDEEVEADLVKKQDQHALMVTLEEGKVENGDTANIDFEGFVDGEPFPGGKAGNHDLVIGSNYFIPGFEEQLVGVEVGQEVDVNVRFPEDYHSEDLKGKEALFKVKVNKIKRKELSPLDDEFAKDISEFATLEELKADIRRKLLDEAEAKAAQEYKKAVVAKAVDNVSVEVPEVMIANRVQGMVEDFYRNLAYQGLQPDMYFEYTKSSEEDLREQIRPQAAEAVKTELVLEAIGKVEGIQVTNEELDTEIAAMSERYRQPAEVIRESLEEQGQMELFKQSMISDKTMEYLAEQNA